MLAPATTVHEVVPELRKAVNMYSESHKDSQEYLSQAWRARHFSGQVTVAACLLPGETRASH